MQDLNDKITGNTLTAAEWNEVPSEIQNVIEALGITLSSGDLNQLGKAIAGYVANGTFYTDSGIANAYVLTKIGLKQTAPAYTDGFELNFIAGNNNTAASTVNAAGLGVKNIKLRNGDNPATGDISGRVSLVFDFGNDQFELINPSVTNALITKPTMAAAKADDALVDSVGSHVLIIRNDKTLPINSVYKINAGHGTDDGGSVLNSDTGTLFNLTLEVKDRKVTFAQFNAAQDLGVTDDSAAFVNLLAFQLATGVIIDGENLTTRLKNIQSLAPTLTFRMQNWNIITGSDYTNQLNLSFTTDVEYHFDDIIVDGERDTRSELEPWSVFATFGGVDSIQPLGVGSFIKIIPFLTNDVYLNKIKFTNCHYQECIEINSFATVFINEFRAKFCSNKTYHIFHAVDGPSDPDTGVTIADDIRTEDCGIMVANFLVDGVAKVRADNFAPQGAFGLLATFGRYKPTNVSVTNYGSIGLLGDRNKLYEWLNVDIFHDDPNAFSNNPSGAMWNESCDKEIGSNLEIKVEARDPRETAIDNSLLQTFCDNGEISIIKGVILETIAGANINKVVRGSHGAGAAQTIDGYSIEATGSNTAVVIANVTGQSNKISFLHGRVRGGDVELRDSLETTIIDMDSVGLLKIKAVVALPIGNVTLDNVTAGNTDIDACSGDIEVNASHLGRLRMAQAFGSSFDKMSVGGGTTLLFNSIITGGRSCTFGQVETERRIDFVDIERVLVNGGPYKTDIGESILNFIPTGPGIMLQASVLSTAMWIKTGTVGAGFTLFNGDVGNSTDIGNDKLTFAWT